MIASLARSRPPCGTATQWYWSSWFPRSRSTSWLSTINEVMTPTDVRPPSERARVGTITRANGLAVLPIGQDSAKAGDRVRVILFRALEDDR